MALLLSACSTPAPEPTNVELARAARRLQGQVDRRMEPGRFATYEDEWRQKVERVGRDHYPEAARGRIHGDLRLTVAIKADGTVQTITLDRSSGHEVLDRAAVRIVELASPFEPFPPHIRRDTDLLVITRTWFFAREVEARQ